MAEHVPVLLEECIAMLNIRPTGIYLDGTLGLGGHSAAIAERLTSGRLIGIDRDETALERASRRLKEYASRVTLVHGSFGHLDEILEQLKIPVVDGMLFDLGVSSPQLDEAERGFSYRLDAPLDMRMDRTQSLTARDVVNAYDETELSRILFQYGEERHAHRIAAAIVHRRAEKPIETTAELVEIIRAAMPAAALREKQHPAKRSFQAVRIEVNGELREVEQMMAAAPEHLQPGGRLCVITFHSLEDRIVKQGIRMREQGCICPREAPVCTCGFRQTLKNLTRKPILPTPEEQAANPRARSAKLRAAERV
ncbi:MAG: 16S rRNA (cytosine(1402)-N(4))-methyltransferase RsmH [Oscillospiraceae bacterium]|nr:16S rRNA (cytosine(1402)-N(4))-methyltransferase RsmH [Oscillospiraceae bacterium]